MCAAIFTDPKGDPFFDGEERDEEEAQKMIHSFSADFGMTTNRTDSRLSLENSGFWLNTTYKKEHFSAFRIADWIAFLDISNKAIGLFVLILTHLQRSVTSR
jgi:hypothetical protein